MEGGRVAKRNGGEVVRRGGGWRVAKRNGGEVVRRGGEGRGEGGGGVEGC